MLSSVLWYKSNKLSTDKAVVSKYLCLSFVSEEKTPFPLTYVHRRPIVFVFRNFKLYLQEGLTLFFLILQFKML